MSKCILFIGCALPGLASLTTGCDLLLEIPPEVETVPQGRPARIEVRAGRIGTLHGGPASAGSARVLDAAFDLGTPACAETEGRRRICVYGGLTAGGESER